MIHERSLMHVIFISQHMCIFFLTNQNEIKLIMVNHPTQGVIGRKTPTNIYKVKMLQH